MSIFKSKVLQVFFVGLVLPFAMLSTSVQAEKYNNGGDNYIYIFP